MHASGIPPPRFGLAGLLLAIVGVVLVLLLLSGCSLGFGEFLETGPHEWIYDTATGEFRRP